MSRHARTEHRKGRAVLAVLLGAVLTAGAGATAAAVNGWLPDGGTADDQVAAAPEPDTAEITAEPTPTPTPTPTPPPDAVLTLVAAGDVLTHVSVNNSVRTSDGDYDFTSAFAPMDDWISGADLALCHMEVPIAPDGVAPSGYPLFGAPKHIATDLAEAGWDGCSTASNHSVDRGDNGLATTLDTFDEVGLGHAGTARTEDESLTTQVYRFQREGQTVTIAHISTTYGTNGMPMSSPWSVDLIDPAAIVSEAAAAREAGADLVVVSVHCCVEYVTEPTEQQVTVAQELADSGKVDLVIGHHAHVPLPFAHLEGGPDGTGMWVSYGLGNYISNQGAHCCTARTDSGLLMVATIRKPVDGPARVEDLQWTAVTVDLSDGHKVQPLSVIAAAGDGVGSLSAGEVQARLERVTDVVGDSAEQITTPPTPSGSGPELDRLETGDVFADD